MTEPRRAMPNNWKDACLDTGRALTEARDEIDRLKTERDNTSYENEALVKENKALYKDIADADELIQELYHEIDLREESIEQLLGIDDYQVELSGVQQDFLSREIVMLKQELALRDEYIAELRKQLDNSEEENDWFGAKVIAEHDSEGDCFYLYDEVNNVYLDQWGESWYKKDIVNPEVIVDADGNHIVGNHA